MTSGTTGQLPYYAGSGIDAHRDIIALYRIVRQRWHRQHLTQLGSLGKWHQLFIGKYNDRGQRQLFT